MAASRSTGQAGPGSVPGPSRLFYFNGFNSAIPADWSDNEKIVGVERLAQRLGFEFLPRTVDYRRAPEQARALRREALAGPRPARLIFSGSSMGGWFARIMQLLLARDEPGLDVRALAFNPAFDLRRHGHLLLGPQTNFVTGESYQWVEADSARLGRLEAAVDYDSPLPFFVYVDKGDEVIDWQASAGRHAPIARFVAFEGGSHLFEHVRPALRDFARAAALEAGPAT